MKYAGMPFGMWTLFAPSFRKQLTAVFGYDTDTAKAITKKSEVYIGYYQPEDGSAAIAVMYVDADGMTLDEYKEKLTEAAATEMEDVVINGMEAVSYVLEESDTACVSFVTEAGFIFEVSGPPKSDENFAALLSMVMASIQAEYFSANNLKTNRE